VKLSDGVTHYELGGPSSGPSVVLVHGFSVPNFVWDPTFHALVAAGFRVLRYDLYGRGYSDRPKANYDIDLFDRQLRELLKALGMVDPINFAGLSMGGPIVLTYADRNPKKIGKLVLVDPAGFPIPMNRFVRLLLLPRVGEVLLGIIGNETILKPMAKALFDASAVDQFIDRYRSQMRYKGFKHALLSTIRNGMLGDFSELYRRVGEQTAFQIMLVWGREDHVVPFAHSQFVLEAIPQAQFHAIDNAGHIPHYERPDVVNPAIIRFLTAENM